MMARVSPFGHFKINPAQDFLSPIFFANSRTAIIATTYAATAWVVADGFE